MTFKISYCQPLVIYPKGIRQFIERGHLKWFNMCLPKWWAKNPIKKIYTLSSIVYGKHYPFDTFSTHSSKNVWLHSNAKFVVYPHVFKIMCIYLIHSQWYSTWLVISPPPYINSFPKVGHKYSMTHLCLCILL